MSIQNHVFHTKHDFTPELGWAAFQLLTEIGTDGIKPAALHVLAKAVASPLTKRSALNKLLAAMLEVGLVERTHEEVRLSVHQTGLWSAMLFEAGARFGHWVCVLGLDHAGRVMILDPADGTRYVMEIEEFVAHWTLFLCLSEVKMIAVQNVSPLGSDCHFVVDLMADGKLKTYRVAVESIMVDGKTIERIVCEDGLSQLLTHTLRYRCSGLFLEI